MSDLLNFDPTDHFAMNETANSLAGFDNDVAEIAKFDDQTYSSSEIADSVDYQLTSSPSFQTDFAQTGSAWDPQKNILAAYYDGAGAIVNTMA